MMQYDINDSIMKGKLKFPKNLSTDAKDIILSLLNRNPN